MSSNMSKLASNGCCHSAFRLMDLFDSEDPRERDYLKTILHRIYGTCCSGDVAH